MKLSSALPLLLEKKLLFWILAIWAIWIAFDLLRPLKVDLGKFDASQTARLETDMWRSYYEKKPVRLLLQSRRLIATQLGAPYWRSWWMALLTARSAFTFKQGKNRDDYNKALPALSSYYKSVSELSNKPFNADSASRLELEWWIIRREPKLHEAAEWDTLQARIASMIYGRHPLAFVHYGHLRTEAMQYRDQKGTAITEADWLKVGATLQQAWLALKDSLPPNPMQ